MKANITRWHEQVFDIYNLMFNHRIITSYIGPFDRNVLISLGLNIRENLKDNATQAKKFFKIFIELAHNISLYSLEKDRGNGCGTIIINEFLEYFTLTGGNIITQVQKEHLQTRINYINSLNREQLREFKRKLLSQTTSDSNSGNIGLVQIALISRHPLEVKFVPLNSQHKTNYFYIISVRIDKKHKFLNGQN